MPCERVAGQLVAIAAAIAAFLTRVLIGLALVRPTGLWAVVPFGATGVGLRIGARGGGLSLALHFLLSLLLALGLLLASRLRTLDLLLAL